MQPTSFEQANAITVSEFYDVLKNSIKQHFSSPLWLTGEIRQLTIHPRSGHVYIDLCDPNSANSSQTPTLNLAIWKSIWGQINKKLENYSLKLKEGQVIKVFGSPDVYAPASRISFIVRDLDIDALIGSLKKKRDLLIKKIKEQKVDQLNKSLPLSALPMDILLIGSPETEGVGDFIKQLKASGYGFNVTIYPVIVQGDQALPQLLNALDYLNSTSFDLAVIVRGGGSRTDLSVFDEEYLAYKIASAKVPIFTGIGHSGDISVADIVAYRSFETPTACGKAIVELIKERANELDKLSKEIVKISLFNLTVHWNDLKRMVDTLARSVSKMIDMTEADISAKTKYLYSQMNQKTEFFELIISQLCSKILSASKQAERILTNNLIALSGKLMISSDKPASKAEEHVNYKAFVLKKSSLYLIEKKLGEVKNFENLLQAYDPKRQLERGWTITQTSTGQIIRSINEVKPTDMIKTTLKDGVLSSYVQEVKAE
jgi:exodeoxyribonuclease VII large subunit